MSNMDNPRLWWKSAQIKSYADAVKYYSKCRNHLKGRPFRSWGRVFMETNGDVRFEVYDRTLCVISPDNVLTMKLTDKDVKSVAITLAQSLYLALPIMWQRVGTGRYRVEHVESIPFKRNPDNDKVVWLAWQHMRKDAPEYFEGIQFDLSTYKCINPRPDVLSTINTDKRKEWLRLSRKFKTKCKIMARMGLFDTNPQPTTREQLQHRITGEKIVEELSEAMRTEVISDDLRRYIGRSAQYSYGSGSLFDKTVAVIDNLLRTHSLSLRKQLGVFGTDENVLG